ncbi:MAG: helix-turn-helix domain-containing protein [Clostridia bacterium]|nr:helix-turn-helix domain-containing protein [Clostridia bacterium]
MDSFGQNLKSLRKRKGLTQLELAKKLGVQKTTVSNYETSVSSPPKNVLVEIARFFDVSLDELLGAREEKPAQNSSFVLKEGKNNLYSQNKTVKIFSEICDRSEIANIRNGVASVSFSDLGSGEYFGLVQKDGALSARGISERDYIIFKTMQVVSNGDLVAVSVDEKPAVVGVFHETESEIGIIPPTVTPVSLPMFFPKKSGNVKILGKAVKAVKNTI